MAALFNALAQNCRGKALNVVRRSERGNGFQAWAMLVREYQPDLAGRHTAILMSLLAPSWPED
eukprot:1483202-Prorocentrum_lima.AAC.1